MYVKCVRVLQEIYEDSVTDGLKLGVGLHQGSTLEVCTGEKKLISKIVYVYVNDREATV